MRQRWCAAWCATCTAQTGLAARVALLLAIGPGGPITLSAGPEEGSGSPSHLVQADLMPRATSALLLWPQATCPV
jgi:hypothetical protein